MAIDGLRVILMAAALFAAHGFARAQTGSGDPEAGGALARSACSPCHEVGPGPPAPRILPIAPAFQAIADQQGMTQTALNAFLLTSHPKMPNFILAADQRADVIAYILSLHGRR
jgi:mono/diheme cytochrome c family protein